MIIIKATREQWRAMESLKAPGGFRVMPQDSGKTSYGLQDAEVVAMLAAARQAGFELSKRPRFLENPMFVTLRDVACILDAALSMHGLVSDCS